MTEILMEFVAPLLPRALLQAGIDKAYIGDERRPLVIEPSAPHTHTFIHCVEFMGRADAPWFVTQAFGMSSDNQQARIFREVMAPRLPSVRWVILSPPKRTVKYIAKKLGGKKIRVPSWYDFESMECTSSQDLESQCDGVRRLAAGTRDLIYRYISCESFSPTLNI